MTTSTLATDRGDSPVETPALEDLTTRYQIGIVRQHNPQAGKVGWAILWLLGIPLPVLLVVYLIWGH